VEIMLKGDFKDMKKAIKLFSLLVIVYLVLSVKAYAVEFDAPVPKGKEIDQPEIVKLFIPDFPYKWIKAIETEEGKRYVIIKAKKRISREAWLNYYKETLYKRGITVYHRLSPRTNDILVSTMNLYRVRSEKPYVIEFSNISKEFVEGDIDYMVRYKGKYMIVFIDRNFGKKFIPFEIYPEKDVPCPDPPYVGSYPDAKKLTCNASFVEEAKKRYYFYSVTRDSAEKVYDYYRDRLKAHYDELGMIYPERKWKISGISDILGIRIDRIRINQNWRGLERQKTQKQIVTPPPSDGMLAHIIIYRIGVSPITDNFSLIKYHYMSDQEKVRKEIERMKSRNEWRKKRQEERERKRKEKRQ
jgi:hypothetical protein